MKHFYGFISSLIFSLAIVWSSLFAQTPVSRAIPQNSVEKSGEQIEKKAFAELSDFHRQRKAQTITEDFNFSASIGTFTSIAETGTPVNIATIPGGGADDGTARFIPVPPNFEFYFDGMPVYAVSVCTNGWLSFNPGAPTTAQGYNKPNDLAKDRGMRPFVAPLYGDLYVNGDIYYQTDGIQPNRTFTFEWHEVIGFANDTADNATNCISFQVVLYEATSDIQFIYAPGPDAAILDDNGSGLAIGLVDTSGGFISVSSLTDTATVSSTTENDSVYVTPVNGLTFTFTPSPFGATEEASEVFYNSANLNGIVFPSGSSVDAKFLYGTTSGVYSDSIDASPKTVTGSSSVFVSASLTGLIHKTTYYYKIATTAGGKYSGGVEKSFTTGYEYPGSALKFDGADDYVEARAMTNQVAGFVIEGWVKWNGTTANDQLLFYMGDFDTTGYGVFLDHTNSDKVALLAGGSFTKVSRFQLVEGEWTHVALACDNSANWIIYVNGESDALGAGSANPPGGGSFFVGGHDGSPTESFNGLFDEVRFRGSSIDSGHIRRRMHLVLPTRGAYDNYCLEFNSESGTLATETAGDNNGVLFNFDFSSSDGWIPSTAPIGPGSGIHLEDFSSGTAVLYNVSMTMADPFDNPVQMIANEIGVTPDPMPTGSAVYLSDRYWIIKPYGTPGTFSANLTFTVPSWFTAASAGTYTLYHRDDNANGPWTAYIDHASNVNANTIEFDDITSFSQFMIGSSDAGLAVQATDFVAKSDIGSVTLSWKTQSEVNNAGFNVLREDPNTTVGSTSLTTGFKLIASYTSNDSLRGLGTSSTGRAYDFTDNKVISGKTYQYKIRSVSTDGTTSDLTTLSVTVDIPKNYALYQNYPNPFNPSTTIRFDLKQISDVTLEIYNTLGQRVEYWNFGMMDAGRYNENINMAGFASGVYFYRVMVTGVNGEKFVSKKKLVQMK